MQKQRAFLRILTLTLAAIFSLTLLAACAGEDLPSTEDTDSESDGLFLPSEEEGDSDLPVDSQPEADTENGTSDEEPPVSSEEGQTSEPDHTDSAENPDYSESPDTDTPSENSSTQTNSGSTNTNNNTSSSGYVALDTVAYGKLGLKGTKVESSNPEVAKGQIQTTNLSVFAYATGKATLTVTDCFGFTAKIDVTVDAAAKKMTCTPKDLPDFIEVSMDFGAKGNGSTDDTTAFQNALNAAKPGDTVYVYPGRYPVSLLTIPEGVTLKMYTTMTDASAGYTSQLKKDFDGKKIAILVGTRLLNVKNNTPGRNGSSNFKIIGGAIDSNLKARSAFIFGNAKNITIENVLFKDIQNEHMIQLTGCVNATVKNCIFAGFLCGDSFTREIIQVEPSTPGATGSAATAPITFGEGEYFLPENITITDCYFGKSDKAGAPLMAIGHHSQVGGANVTNFKITNNVFDECIYAAIRYNNLVNVEITGNTFRSTSAYKNNPTKYSDAVEPAFIQFYHHTGNTTYKNQSGTTVTRAKADEQAGLHNIRIENNTFEVGQGADKKIIRYVGSGAKMGAFYTSGTRQDTYLGETYSLSGYRAVTNYASDITFKNNTVTFTGKPTYTDWYISLDPIYNLDFSNNTINLASGLSFSKGTNGQVINSYTTSQHQTIQIAGGSSSRTVKFVGGSKTYTFTVTTSGTVSFVMDAGGNLPTVTADKTGNLTVTLNPKSGYSFDKIATTAGAEVASSVTVNGATQYNVVFKK